MPSQFFGLEISSSGLRAANAALNTTANNIANADTDGYSRQRVQQQAQNALRVFTTYGCAGAGVDTIAIERMRDEFYDVRYWESCKYLGEYDIKQYYMSSIEEYFTDDGKTGFTTLFNKMTTGLQEIAKNAGSATTITDFLGSATSLAEYFNKMCANLNDLQADINQELKLQVDSINSMASEIATLNKQINVIEMSDGVANELRDRRALLIDELAQIVDVTTEETKIYDSNDPDRETGGTRYIVRIAGGQILVDGNDAESLECRARTAAEKVNDSDIDGLYDIYWGGTNDKFGLSNASLGGKLKGLIQMRDGNNGENFGGTITDVSQLNNTVTVEVTSAWTTDLNKSNLNGTGTIRLKNTEYVYDSWTYYTETDTEGNTHYYYDFQLSSSNINQVTTGGIGYAATTGSSIDYEGIPYYQAQMNEWIRTFSQQVNDILLSGYNAAGDAGVILLTGDLATDVGQFSLVDPDLTDTETNAYYNVPEGNTVRVSSTDDSYWRLNARNFATSDVVLNDPNLLATKASEHQTDGESQYSNVNKLLDMFKDKDQMVFRGCTAGEFLTTVLSDIALNTNSANTFYTNYTNITQTIDNQRLSVSGVDEEEEALDLVKYQNIYNLSSKMIQTLTEVYDRLITQTGV